MYAIRTRYVFKALHALRDAAGVSEDVHPHSFNVEVEISSPELDPVGCVMDFHELDRRIGDVIGPLRGCELSALPLFEGRSTSAEEIACVLHGEIGRALADLPVGVTVVTVWEDERHGGCFRETA